MTALDICLAAWAMVATGIATGKHLAIRRMQLETTEITHTIVSLAEQIPPDDAPHNTIYGERTPRL